MSRVVSRSKSRVIDLKIKEVEISRISQEAEIENKDVKDGWTEILISLSDDVGYPLHPDTMTVYEFAIRHKNLISKLKSKAKNASKMAALPSKIR